MKILFTPAGDTDPVRGFRDGAILHILRHYGPMEKVYLFLTKQMEEKEKEEHCYTRGILQVSPGCDIHLLASGIEEPQKYETLTALQDAFYKAYAEYPDAEWYLNISSGTPQIKTIMTLLGMDYPKAHTIQVATPEKGSNKRNHPEETKDLIEMLGENEDNDPESPNRCSEPDLSLLKKHGLILQITSLVGSFEYEAALHLVRQNRSLFTKDTEKLLTHAVYRENLQWKKANQVMTSWKGNILLQSPDDFTEYFQVMELRQRKNQLPEFIVKTSPILTALGMKYLKELPSFDLERLREQKREGRKQTKEFRISRKETKRAYPGLLAFLESEETTLKGSLRDDPLYFGIMVYICKWLKNGPLSNNKKHLELTDIFVPLRKVEKNARNSVAHTITNLTEEQLKKETGMNSTEILRLLRRAAFLVRGKEIPRSYDRLNGFIRESLSENPES